MAAPAQAQAEVQRTTLTAAAARSQMANPVEIRRGELRSVTITIPLLSEANSYLVARLPNDLVQEAVRQARELPEAERPAFLRDWIMRNQQAVLEQYVRTGRSERRFRYDVVPVPTRIGEATPRRVSEEPRPISRNPLLSPHRRIEQRHLFDDGRDVAPPGWRRPREGELPQDVLTRANVIQPRRGRALIPLGDALTEEFNGRRYLYLACYHTVPAPRHASVSVFVQAEQPAREPQIIRPPETRGARETARPAPVERREIPVPPPRPAERQLPPFPSQIRGGNGSATRPYEVYLTRAEIDRETRREGGDTIVNVPLNLDIEGLGALRFTIAFRARQLTASARSTTQGELWGIIRQTADRVAAERGIRVDNTAFRTAQSSYSRSFPQIMARIEAADAELGEYLRSH